MVICKWNFVRSGCYVTVPIYIKQRFSKTEWVCIPETSRLDTRVRRNRDMANLPTGGNGCWIIKVKYYGAHLFIRNNLV